MIRIFLLSIASCSLPALAQQVYTGLDVEFNKAPSTNPALPENQDRITGSVWLTRANFQGIFNIAQEPSYQGQGAASPSPVGTRWAFGSAEDHASLIFGTWGDMHQGLPMNLIGVDMVLHLVQEDIYIDLRFTSWGGPGTGSFGYLRSAIPSPCGIADLVEPFGVLDLGDIGAFVNAFIAGEPIADLAPPAGVYDLADLGAFVGAFLAGCP